MSDQLLAEAHRFLAWARERGARLDGTDESVWFVQGVLESMADDPDEDPSFRAVKCLGYSVYLAELLADTCTGVERVIDGEGMGLNEVLAVREGGAMQFTLTWVQRCLDDPKSDNIVFKYAGALRDFGEHERSKALNAELREATKH
ncbi:hypothetical protein [Spirillospora sp. CA-294931]|uniref:hypothetical protein n=1 Tax=Spirillospora sp. CA-294931 TaxID=3240042 RepID=UPI003D8F931D